MRKIRTIPYDLQAGRVIAGKYEVLGKLGAGWEGEVYRVVERETGIHRAAKLFFEERNPRNRTLRAYAQKLHRLRECPMVIQYVTPETVQIRGRKLFVLVSEYVEGPLLSDFVMASRGQRLSPFQAVHLLHAMASGMEYIHNAGEYHGDLHWDNVIVERFGLRFHLKLVDLFLRGGPRPDNILGDVVDMVKIFYDALGGRDYYSDQPPPIKAICCGLKQSLIRRKYRTAGQLRQYLEAMEWST